jgi:hypothetical protein
MITRNIFIFIPVQSGALEPGTPSISTFFEPIVDDSEGGLAVVHLPLAMQLTRTLHKVFFHAKRMQKKKSTTNYITLHMPSLFYRYHSILPVHNFSSILQYRNHCYCHCHFQHVFFMPPARSKIKNFVPIMRDKGKQKRGHGPCPLERLRKKWFSFSPRAARGLAGQIGDLRFAIRVFCPLYSDPFPRHFMSGPNLL